jgi:hypothetical protein
MSKLAVAGLAYTVEAETEEQAENMLLDFLSSIDISNDQCHILKIWVSARQDAAERVQVLQQKEQEALDG